MVFHMGWLKTILDIILAIFGVVPKADSAEMKAEKTGVTSGKAQAEAANATAAVHEVQGAVAAGEAERARIDADPSWLHDPANPVASAYKPGSAD